MNDNQIDAEISRGQTLCRGDLFGELRTRHGPASQHAKPAPLGDGRDEMALGNPSHRATQNRCIDTEKGTAALG